MASNIKVFRLLVPEEMNALVFHAANHSRTFRKVWLKNVSEGLTPPTIKFNFDDDSSSNYISLYSQDESPVMEINGFTSIYFDASGAGGIIEVIIWEY